MPVRRQEERQSFSKHLIGGGLVDVFREQHPDVRGYTYWHYITKARERNHGWRIDYFLVCLTISSKGSSLSARDHMSLSILMIKPGPLDKPTWEIAVPLPGRICSAEEHAHGVGGTNKSCAVDANTLGCTLDSP